MRKNILGLIVVLLLVVVGFGFYRGWFGLSGAREVNSHKVNINLTVDPDKVKQDAELVKEKTTELTDKITDEVNPSNDPQHTDSNRSPE